jgi:hypothetical protein
VTLQLMKFLIACTLSYSIKLCPCFLVPIYSLNKDFIRFRIFGLLSKISISIPNLSVKAHFGGAKKYISLMNLLSLRGGEEAIIVISRIAGSRSPKQGFIAIFPGKYGFCIKENPLPLTEEDLLLFYEELYYFFTSFCVATISFLLFLTVRI